jgi:hypothetical protein
VEQQPIELDAFVTQGIALVDADHHGRQASDIVFSREARPRERVAALELVDAVAHRAAVVVQVEEDPVVLDRRRVLGQGLLVRDVRTQRVEDLDQAEVAVLLQLEPVASVRLPPPLSRRRGATGMPRSGRCR